MRGKLAIAILALLVAASAFPVATWLSGRVYLPRHSAARDLPWSRTARNELALSEPLNHTMSDKFNLSCPDVFHGIREVQSGRYPLWNDLLLGGVPHLANPTTGVAYPPNLLLLLCDPFDALVVGAGLHLLLCATFMLLFLRRIGLGIWPAFFGGVSFMFSGWVAGHLQNGMTVAVVCWVPLGLLAIESFFQTGRRRGLFLLTLAVGMMWLAGFPQLALLGTLALGLYALPQLLLRLRGTGGRRTLLAGGVLTGFAALGLLLAAVHLVPLIEVMEYGEHQDRSAADLAGERYRPAGFLGLLLPTVIGDPTQDTHWRQELGARMFLAESGGPGEPLPPPFMNWSERTLYPGFLVLLLAVAGLLWRPPGPALRLAFVAGVGLLLAMSPWFIQALQGVPGFGVGAPGRSVFVLAIVLPVLAACGLQRLLDRSADERLAGRRVLVVMVAVPALLLLITVAWGFADPGSALRTTISGLKGAGMEARLEVTRERSVEEYELPLTPFFQRLRGDLSRLAIVLALSALILYLAWRRPARAGLLTAGLILVSTGDLLFHLVPYNLPVLREGLLEETPAITFLRENLHGDRFVRVHADKVAALEEGDALYIPNLGMLAGLRDAQGYREMAPRHYRLLWKDISPLVLPYGFAGLTVDKVGARLVDLARVRYLVAGTPLEKLESRRVHPPPGAGGADLFVYSNPGVFPHAWVAGKSFSQDAGKTRELLSGPGYSLTDTVILNETEHTGGPPPKMLRIMASEDDAPEGVAVLVDEPGRLEFEVPPGSQGHLVISDTWFPGWEATLVAADGSLEAAPVLRAFEAFRAVPLQESTTSVRLDYRPGSFAWGWKLSLLALVVAAVLAFWPAKRRQHEPVEVDVHEFFLADPGAGSS